MAGQQAKKIDKEAQVRAFNEEQLAALGTISDKRPEKALGAAEKVGVLKEGVRNEIDEVFCDVIEPFLEIYKREMESGKSDKDARIKAFELVHGEAGWSSPEFDESEGVFMSTMKRVLNRESYERMEDSFAIKSAKIKLSALTSEKARERAKKRISIVSLELKQANSELARLNKDNRILEQAISSFTKKTGEFTSFIKPTIKYLSRAKPIPSESAELKKSLGFFGGYIERFRTNRDLLETLQGSQKLSDECQRFLTKLRSFNDPLKDISAKELRKFLKGNYKPFIAEIFGLLEMNRSQNEKSLPDLRDRVNSLDEDIADLKSFEDSAIEKKFEIRLDYREEASDVLKLLKLDKGTLISKKKKLEKLERKKASDVEQTDKLQKRIDPFDQQRSDALKVRDDAQLKIDSLKPQREKAKARNDMILTRVSEYPKLINSFEMIQGALSSTEFEKFVRKASLRKLFGYFDDINPRLSKIKDSPFLHDKLKVSCVAYLDAFKKGIEPLRNAGSVDRNLFIEFFKNKLVPFVAVFSDDLHMLDRFLPDELQFSETKLERLDSDIENAQSGLEKSNEKVSDLNSKIENLRSDLQKSNDKLSGLESKIESLRSDLKNADELLIDFDDATLEGDSGAKAVRDFVQARFLSLEKEKALMSNVLNTIKSNSDISSSVKSIVNNLQKYVNIKPGVMKIKKELNRVVFNIVYSLENDSFDRLLPGIEKKWSDFLRVFDEFLDRPDDEITIDEVKNIFTEFDSLVSGLRKTVISKKAKIDSLINQLMGGKNRISQEKDEIQKERDESDSSRNELIEEKNRISREKDKISQEKDKAREERDKIDSLVNQLKLRSGVLIEERDRFSRDVSDSDLSQQTIDNAPSEGEIAVLERSTAALEAEIEKLDKDLQSFNGEVVVLDRNIVALDAEIDTLDRLVPENKILKDAFPSVDSATIQNARHAVKIAKKRFKTAKGAKAYFAGEASGWSLGVACNKFRASLRADKSHVHEKKLQSSAKSLHESMKTFAQYVSKLIELGVITKPRANYEINNIITKIDSIDVDSPDFKYKELADIYNDLKPYYKALIGKLDNKFLEAFARLKQDVKEAEENLKSLEEQKAANTNLNDVQVAKRIFQAIVAEQHPNLLPEERPQLASASLADDIQTLKTKQSREKLAEKADAETVKTVDAINFAGIQDKLINFRYKLNDKIVQPFKNFKSNDFATWKRMKELFYTGRLDRQNGFFVLAAFEIFAGEDKTSEQAEGLKTKLTSLLEEELGGDKDKVKEAFRDQLKKIKPLVSEFLDLNATPDSQLKDRKTQELTMRIGILNEQLRLGKIEKSVYELRRKQILEEATANGIEDRLSQSTALSGFWHSKHSQWLRDSGYALGSYGARKTKALGFAGLELYGRGLWGATKLAFSTAWNGVKRVPFRAIKNTATLAATPIKGLVNLKRWISGQKYWTPFSIAKNVREDLEGIKGFVSKKGTETFEGTKTAFKTVPGKYWGKEAWKSKKYADRTTKDVASLESQADELKKAAEMPCAEIDASPFIDLKSYREKKEKEKKKKKKKKSNKKKSASDGSAEKGGTESVAA